MTYLKFCVLNSLIVLFFSSCNENGFIENENSDKKSCVSCFNILLKDSFDEDENIIFDRISYSTPNNIDTIFYKEIDNYYSFFVKLENDNQFLHLYVDTFDITKRGIKFYLLNSINGKTYINQNESFVTYFSFLNPCECDCSDSLLSQQLKSLPMINTYDTNLFGTWTSDEGIEISFEEHYFVVNTDTIDYQKTGSYLVDKTSSDTLATIQAISKKNLILNCNFIQNGEMIYYKKTILHPLSIPKNENSDKSNL